MSFRTAILPALDAIRTNVLGPSGLDLHATTVSIVTQVWTGGFRDAGFAEVIAKTDLPAGVKVRHVTQREIAGSGGEYEEGDVVVSLITPQYTNADGSTGGFTEAQLMPVVTEQGTEVIYQLAQQVGHATGIVGEYARAELRRDRALHFEMVLTKRRTTP